MKPELQAIPVQPEMDKPDLVRRVRLECRSQIEQHFPPYRQFNALREAILGLRDGREMLEQQEAWIAACKDACDVHEANIAELSDDMIASYDVFSGWPKYDGRKRTKKPDPIASLEAIQHKLDAREVEGPIAPTIQQFVQDELIEGETWNDGFKRLEMEWDRLQQKKLYGSATEQDKLDYDRLQAGLMKG